jgi:hypothetical protein
MPTLLKDTFSAWIDKMPPANPRLIVTGEVQVPTSGWKVKLVRKIPQGINPNILLLDVEATAPHGTVSQLVTTIPVRYEEGPPEHDYTDVTVFAGSDQVTVKVGTAK